MNIIKILGKIVGSIVPTLSKEKSKVEAIDSIISKRGNASKAEVLVALGYKYARLGLYSYVTYNVIAGNVEWGELVKALALQFGG